MSELDVTADAAADAMSENGDETTIDSDTSPPTTFRTIRCPLIQVTPTLPNRNSGAASSSAHSIDRTLSSAQAACILISIIQHIVVQLQLTTWFVIARRNRAAAMRSVGRSHLHVCSR